MVHYNINYGKYRDLNSTHGNIIYYIRIIFRIPI